MRTKRKSLIEERYYKIKRTQMSFISMVQERASKLQYSLVSYFPNDLMFRVFLLLPLKSLLRVTCVCKSWYKLIHCAEFVEAYNSQAQTTLILLREVNIHPNPNIFHVETQLNQSENFSLFPSSNSGSSQGKFIHFLEIEGENCKIMETNVSFSGSVLSSCNGLILIRSLYKSNYKMSRKRPWLDSPVIGNCERPGRLIVMNPMTRKFIGLPLGTLPYAPTNRLPHGSENESYGLVYSHLKNAFKVVHLFKDKLGYIACETLSLHDSRSWKGVDGPSQGLLKEFGPQPVSTNGALYWIPDFSGIDYIVSMGADDEKFTSIGLPNTVGVYDRLVEMGGFLSFVTSLDKDHIEVWILKGLESSEWVKQHDIHIDAVLGHVENHEFSIPMFAINVKELVFRRRKQLYLYDFEHEEVRELEIEGTSIGLSEYLLPHSNNLATWEPLEPMS